MTHPGPPSPAESDSGFSDSDQAWFDRLAAARGAADEPAATPAQREADALRRALALQRAGQAVDPQVAEASSDEARERRWQQVQFRLRREGLSQGGSRPGWRTRAGWAAGLAASLLLAVVLVVQQLGEQGSHYGEPPVMRGEHEVLKIADADPRRAAQALASELQGMGLAATLHQKGKVYVLDTTLEAATTAAPAVAKLRALGAQAQPGLLRIEFAPR